MKHVVYIWLLSFFFTACADRPLTCEECVANIVVTPNTNLIFTGDSILLELLPVKDTYVSLHKGDQVVVAEVAIYPEEGIDSIQVKIAHDQEVQGWIPQRLLIHSFISTDSISQIISLMHRTSSYYFYLIAFFFILLSLYWYHRKKTLHIVFFNDIDSIYPMLLCLLVAIHTTIYESIRIQTPDMWWSYYFSPTLSPFQVPFTLSVLIVTFWVIVIVGLAAIDDIFRKLSLGEALFYLLGLSAVCILCNYLFFYVSGSPLSWVLLVCFTTFFAWKSWNIVKYRYRCGNCGYRMKAKGVCPACGVVNS